MTKNNQAQKKLKNYTKYQVIYKYIKCFISQTKSHPNNIDRYWMSNHISLRHILFFISFHSFPFHFRWSLLLHLNITLGFLFDPLKVNVAIIMTKPNFWIKLRFYAHNSSFLLNVYKFNNYISIINKIIRYIQHTIWLTQISSVVNSCV